jgi:hypothetical protein
VSRQKINNEWNRLSLADNATYSRTEFQNQKISKGTAETVPSLGRKEDVKVR